MSREQRIFQRVKHNLYRCFRVGLASLALVFGFTGCGNAIPDMSGEEEQQVSEYAALMLLKYDANNRSRLVDLALFPEEPEQTEPPAEETQPETEGQGMGPVADTPVTELPQEGTAVSEGTVGSEGEFFSLPEGVSLDFNGTQTCKSYPPEGETNGYLAVDAAEGESLLVLQYTLNNQSGTDQTVDLLGQKAVIRVTINGELTEFAQTTMLENDLATYSGTIGAGQSKELVLIVEIDQETADNISSVSINLKNDANTYSAPLL